MQGRVRITDRASSEWCELGSATTPSVVDCGCWGWSQRRPLSGVQGCAGDLSGLCGSVCRATQGVKAREGVKTSEGEGCKVSNTVQVLHWCSYSRIRSTN